MSNRPGIPPIRAARVLIEDPALVPDDLRAREGVFQITACAGPGDGRICPLVSSGRCPQGPFDVVVSALDGPWGSAVRSAWAETATPVVDRSGPAAGDTSERLAQHMGAALQCLWAAPADI